jgi:hypothetical protein
LIANAIFLAVALLLALGFWLMGELRFFIPYKTLLLNAYGRVILIYVAVLFVNLCAGALAFVRKFFLKDTGRKLSHLDKQFRLGESEVAVPSFEQELD